MKLIVSSYGTSNLETLAVACKLIALRMYSFSFDEGKRCITIKIDNQEQGDMLTRDLNLLPVRVVMKK